MADGQLRMLSVQRVTVGGTDQGLWELRASEDTGSAPLWSYPTMDPAAIHNVLMQEVRSSAPAAIPENLRPSGDRTREPAADSRSSHASAPPPVDPYPRPEYVRPNDPYAPDPYQRSSSSRYSQAGSPPQTPAPAPQPAETPRANAQGFIPLGPGQMFVDRYEILAELGHGGMGMVYKARQLHIDRTVAIKLLRPQYLSDQVSQGRFMQEAKTASSLTHPNVIMIFDFGFTNRGEPYIVMDYAEGPDLQDILKAYTSLEDLKTFLNIIGQTCLALSHAHAKGLVHRDIKPSNIKLIRNDDGSIGVKILDFGLAKLVNGEDVDQRLTQSKDIVGSPLYMSPEQCQGGQIDHRSDIYSLGVVMYEALTGMPPLCGKNVWETILKHIQEDPAPMAQVRPDLSIPPEVEKLVRKAMARDVQQRYQSIEELGNDLIGLLRLGVGITRVSSELPDLPEPDLEVVVTNATVGALTIADLLKEANIITEEQWKPVKLKFKEVGGELGDLMIKEGLVEPFIFDAASKCVWLMNHGHLTPPKAIVALRYCLRGHLIFERATQELGWALPAVPAA